MAVGVFLVGRLSGDLKPEQHHSRSCQVGDSVDSIGGQGQGVDRQTQGHFNCSQQAVYKNADPGLQSPDLGAGDDLTAWPVPGNGYLEDQLGNHSVLLRPIINVQAPGMIRWTISMKTDAPTARARSLMSKWAQ